jgi:hypothetical protein
LFVTHQRLQFLSRSKCWNMSVPPENLNVDCESTTLLILNHGHLYHIAQSTLSKTSPFWRSSTLTVAQYHYLFQTARIEGDFTLILVSTALLVGNTTEHPVLTRSIHRPSSLQPVLLSPIPLSPKAIQSATRAQAAQDICNVFVVGSPHPKPRTMRKGV